MPSIKPLDQKMARGTRANRPAGWMAFHVPHRQPHVLVSPLCRPDGTHACSMHKKDARVFADAMNGVVRRLLRKLGLTSRKW